MKTYRIDKNSEFIHVDEKSGIPFLLRSEWDGNIELNFLDRVYVENENLYVKGNFFSYGSIELLQDVRVNGDIFTGGNIFCRNIFCGRSIRSTSDIIVGKYLFAGDYIFSGGNINGDIISAGGYIHVAEGINSKEGIFAGGDIHAQKIVTDGFAFSAKGEGFSNERD